MGEKKKKKGKRGGMSGVGKDSRVASLPLVCRPHKSSLSLAPRVPVGFQSALVARTQARSPSAGGMHCIAVQDAAASIKQRAAPTAPALHSDRAFIGLYLN